MKKLLMFLAVIVISCSNVHAFDSSDYSISVNVGESNKIDIYRLGIQREFCSTVYSFDSFSIKGFHEVGLGYWDGQRNNVKTISYAPVFKIDFHNFSANEYKPYLDLGIGVALISNKKIDNRDMSSTFQFENRVSLGVTRGDWDIYFRYMHYSNGGIKKPNQGIDISSIGFNYRF